jgi:hypothetical protein
VVTLVRNLPRVLKYFRARKSPKAKPVLTQYFEMLLFAARYQLTPREYHLYELWHRGTEARVAGHYLSNQLLMKKFLPKLNDEAWGQVLDNKYVFSMWFGQHVPVPRILGYYHPVFGFRESPSGNRVPLKSKDDFVAMLRDEQFPSGIVIKPIGGIQGKGVTVLTRIIYDNDSPISAVTTDGRDLHIEDLVHELNQAHGVRSLPGYLIQERVTQHAFLDRLNPYTTNTIRIVTFRTDDMVTVDFAILRLGRKGNRVDNWDAGGISVEVDIDSGTLGKGVTKPEYGGEWFARHPDTGAGFEGLTIPMWDAVLDVCKRAAELTPFVRSIGWDVILTPTGPVLLEGNPSWDLNMVQVHSKGYLTAETRQQLQRYGVVLPN